MGKKFNKIINLYSNFFPILILSLCIFRLFLYSEILHFNFCHCISWYFIYDINVVYGLWVNKNEKNIVSKDLIRRYRAKSLWKNVFQNNSHPFIHNEKTMVFYRHGGLKLNFTTIIIKSVIYSLLIEIMLYGSHALMHGM